MSSKTMYNDFLGLISEPSEHNADVIRERSMPVNPLAGREYDTVRFGLPEGVVSFEKTKADRLLLCKHLLDNGYESWPYSKIKSNFRKHVAKFRASLDFWEQFSKGRVFQKEEIYYRCLMEGHSFTEKIKKMRATCFRAFTAETDTEVEEEYYSSDYDGYNSIIHERYLIHWDDRETVDDVKYAFIQTGVSRHKEFSKLVDDMFQDFRLGELDFSQPLDMIGAIKNTKMYDPITKKTSLMREFWSEEVDIKAPYFAKRAVVPTTPGSTRDTGIGDPSTILKVKILNSLARVVSEKVPYSANTDGPSANARLKRVLKKNLFLHLDFKKFGLTFPRELMNILIKKIGEVANLDVSDLLIDAFYVEIDGTVYQTCRGTMLGWLDSINSLCVCAILHGLSKELKFDFITFNDDVEISKRGDSAPRETLELLRMAVISTMNFFDIPISINKTFGSKCSVFLERYAYYSQYGIDMYKEQLTVDAYSKSCVTTEIWQAKLFFAAAEQWTKSKYATDRCIDTCPVEFRKVENTLPLWAGGWYIRRRKGIDLATRYCDRLALRMGMELSKFQSPRYATRPEKVSKADSIVNTVNKKCYYSNTSEAGLLWNQFEVETISQINEEVEYVRSAVETLTSVYPGRNSEWSDLILHIVNQQCANALGYG